METLQKRNGDEDDDCLLAMADFDLLIEGQVRSCCESDIVADKHTSRADTICRGRRVAFRSWVLLSRSNRAPAIADSSSEGFCLDGELGAILLRAAMIADERRVAGLYC